MKRFAELYAELDATASTDAKVAALRSYFAQAPAADAAWGIYFLTGNRLRRIVSSSQLRAWAARITGLLPEVVDESYSHVGDLAETLALLFDPIAQPVARAEAVGLAQWVERLLALADAEEPDQCAQLERWWCELTTPERFLLNKLLTGSFRVGVSAGFAARALAEAHGLPVALVGQRLLGAWQPSAEGFLALVASADEQQVAPSQPYPFSLASPLEDVPDTLGEPDEFLVEWKWDGIRAQVIRRAGETFIWSRGDEALGGRFPEVEAMAARLEDGTVLDGEVLAWRDGVLPFATLQRRIGRKKVGASLLESAPVSFLAYDLLERGGEDWRARPLSERRSALESVALAAGIPVSPRVEGPGWSDLAALRDQARERDVEGLMLKRLDSHYGAGRRRGSWWKWKVGALTVDTVLVYAQAGHGRRSTLYTDYTLAVWDGEALVPVAKAYSGLTDVELLEMDRWIRSHTREKFGPVRSVDPEHVFEIAFEGIQASTRHKSGVALRFPRIKRWRTDKAAREANTLADLRALMRAPPEGSLS